MLGGPQGRSEPGEEPLSLSGIEPRFLRRPVNILDLTLPGLNYYTADLIDGRIQALFRRYLPRLLNRLMIRLAVCPFSAF
jgi:hypothetical protein